MKEQIENAWKAGWSDVHSIEQPCDSYGKQGVMYTLGRLLEGEGRESVLDVGCGVGFYFKFLRGLGFKRLCGIEYDIQNVEHGRMLNAGLPGLQILPGDIRQLPGPLGEEQFDVVISLGLVEHFHYPVPNIRRLLSLVRPGGLLVLEMPNFRNCFFHWHNNPIRDRLPFQLWWGPREWRRVLSRIKDYKLEMVKGCGPMPYWDYVPRLMGKLGRHFLHFEIAVEYRLPGSWGSMVFYRLRRAPGNRIDSE